MLQSESAAVGDAVGDDAVADDDLGIVVDGTGFDVVVVDGANCCLHVVVVGVAGGGSCLYTHLLRHFFRDCRSSDLDASHAVGYYAYLAYLYRDLGPTHDPDLVLALQYCNQRAVEGQRRESPRVRPSESEDGRSCLARPGSPLSDGSKELSWSTYAFTF